MITMRALTNEEQQELITMYQNVVKDFEVFHLFKQQRTYFGGEKK